jgi:hypothetical protein
MLPVLDWSRRGLILVAVKKGLHELAIELLQGTVDSVQPPLQNRDRRLVDPGA